MTARGINELKGLKSKSSVLVRGFSALEIAKQAGLVPNNTDESGFIAYLRAPAEEAADDLAAIVAEDTATAQAAATTATTKAGEASDSATAAATSAQTATDQATIATTQAGIATTQADTATTQAGIATTKAGEADASADAAALSANAAAQSAQDADTARIAAQTAQTEVEGIVAGLEYAVSNPNASTDNAIPRFDGTGGKTLQNSGVSISDSDELMLADGSLAAPSIRFASEATGFYKAAGGAIALVSGGAESFRVEGTLGVGFRSSGALWWTGAANGAYSNRDLVLQRDAANVLAQRHSNNGQTFRLYGTFSDASNYERLAISFTGSQAIIQTEAGGSGGHRKLTIGTVGSVALEFKTANSTRWLIDASGNLLTTDNTHDIGQTAAGRPRDIYVARNIAAGGNLAAGATGTIFWASRSKIVSSADGHLTLTDAANTGFIRLTFGPATASFPSLERSGTELRTRLADGSGWAGFQSGDAQVNGNLTVTDNLTVTGDVTFLGDFFHAEVTNLDVEDPIILLGKNDAAGALGVKGLRFERGSLGDDAFLVWRESDDSFVFGTATDDTLTGLTIKPVYAADIFSNGTQVSVEGHSHIFADVPGLQDALDGKSDTGHTHAIADVTGLQDELDGKSDTGHTHAIADVTGLQAALDDKSDTGHTHVAADITDQQNLKPVESFIIACSDETTTMSAGTAKVTLRWPYAFTISEVRASLSTASSSGTVTVDVNKNGASIFSTLLTIDANEKTSKTAATPAVLSTTAIADDDEITIDLDGAGTGAKGLKVTVIGRRA